jgi:hypothetical protein
MVQTDSTEKICLYTGDRPPPIYAAVADIYEFACHARQGVAVVRMRL